MAFFSLLFVGRRGKFFGRKQTAAQSRRNAVHWRFQRRTVVAAADSPRDRPISPDQDGVRPVSSPQSVSKWVVFFLFLLFSAWLLSFIIFTQLFVLVEDLRPESIYGGGGGENQTGPNHRAIQEKIFRIRFSKSRDCSCDLMVFTRMRLFWVNMFGFIDKWSKGPLIIW